MCCVCDADVLLKASHKGEAFVFRWDDRPEFALEAEAQGKAAEFAQVKLRIRPRWGEGLKETSEWTEWLDSGDLAGTLGRLGTDVKWEYVGKGVKDWLEGLGPIPSI